MAQINGLLDEQISKCLDNAIRQAAFHIHREIEDSYEWAIDKFYNHYDPLVYYRTYGTYYASSGFRDIYDKKPNTPFKHQNDGKGNKLNRTYTSGITVSSNNIPWDYKADNEWVFQRTFNEGIHGITEDDVKKINTTSYKNYNNSHKFSFIKNIPPRMKPTPKEYMDARFKLINNQEHIDKVIDKYLNKELEKILKG